jgi:hypothetical protein
MLIAALFATAKLWKQSRFSTTVEWDKENMVCTMEYHLTIKKMKLCHLQESG